uniref:ribonuclease H n=1 Tax=Knipowitschia caucasica TaxID=637954 RepID=A0AAV2JY53_KNICA
MVQDFRPLNEVTADESYPVPDPYIALNNLSPNDKYFTVIDLANAFFTIKLHPESQKYFAFTVKGRQYTYCRMPQGWKLSPGYFNHFLRLDLAEFNLPEKCTLIQYVDDLAISGPDARNQKNPKKFKKKRKLKKLKTKKNPKKFKKKRKRKTLKKTKNRPKDQRRRRRRQKIKS